MCKIITQNYDFMFILKQLRRKKNINQTDLANVIGVSLRTIQLYEKKDANIPIKNLTKIAQYFEVSLSELYRLELAENGGGYGLDGNQFYGNNEFRPLGEGKYLVTAPFLSTVQQKTYADRFSDDDFMLKCPRTSFMLEEGRAKTYVAFEMDSRAMENGLANGIPIHSVVLGELVPKKNVGRFLDKGGIFIMVYAEGVLCKEVVGWDERTGTLTCHSFNDSPEYADFTLALEEVSQIFALCRKEVPV